MTEPSATASVEVPVDPGTAFEVFTAEIDQWWLRNPISFFDSGRVRAMRIEPGIGGRVMEVYTADDVLERATITEWQPGTRLGYRSSVDDTETRVDFEAVAGGTRVTVVQSLVTDDGNAFYFWPRVIRWLPDWVARRAGESGKPPREIDRLSIALYYEDPAAAARWLHEVFAINSWDTLPAEGEDSMWIELHVGSLASSARARRSSARSTRTGTAATRPRTWKATTGPSRRPAPRWNDRTAADRWPADARGGACRRYGTQARLGQFRLHRETLGTAGGKRFRCGPEVPGAGRGRA